MLNSRTRMTAAAAVVLVAAAALSACGGAKAGDEPAAAAESCVDTSGSTVKLGFINSLTGAMAISEKTVSKVPAIGLTTSCAPPRTAETGPAPRTSSVIRVTAVRTISARIVRRRFARWYTITGPLAPLSLSGVATRRELP